MDVILSFICFFIAMTTKDYHWMYASGIFSLAGSITYFTKNIKIEFRHNITIEKDKDILKPLTKNGENRNS